MWIPPQGFRHAATLLLRSGARRISQDPAVAASRLEALAEELVALARDTHVDARASDWMTAEYAAMLDLLSPALGLDPSLADELKTRSANRFNNIQGSLGEHKDIFLIYLPEDRLPLAAPLAIELEKRRISVAFSEFEIANPDELESALDRGLARHGAGVLVWTPHAARMLATALDNADLDDSRRKRLRVVDAHGRSIVEDLLGWFKTLSRSL